jgi:hypothetical protein
MQTNALPRYDATDNPTGCCPRFNPTGWDGQELHFQDKLFVSARTKSVAHIPLNMGAVFRETFAAIERAHARDPDDFLVLSRDRSAWSAEHLFSVAREVPGLPMTRLNGAYRTRVFEGPYKQLPTWAREVAHEAKGRSREVEDLYFFYTTCPNCAKVYGKNYVVAVAKERDATTVPNESELSPDAML